jgi:hypothetical protein
MLPALFTEWESEAANSTAIEIISTPNISFLERHGE